MLKTLDIQKMLDKYNKGKKYPYTFDQFAYDAKRYISAIKDSRMICSIGSVSASGMSRTVKFVEMAKCKKPHNKPYALLNFYQFFCALEYRPAGKYGDYFRIYGCGMDMIFHTNYTIIGTLERLGFLSKKLSSKLRQDTPPVL